MFPARDTCDQKRPEGGATGHAIIPEKTLMKKRLARGGYRLALGLVKH
jgi:hypothetical protein